MKLEMSHIPMGATETDEAISASSGIKMAEKTLESLGLRMAAGPFEKLNATADAFFYDLSALTPQEQVGFSLGRIVKVACWWFRQGIRAGKFGTTPA